MHSLIVFANADNNYNCRVFSLQEVSYFCTAAILKGRSHQILDLMLDSVKLNQYYFKGLLMVLKFLNIVALGLFKNLF
jgi:hypothetical protein